MSLMGILIMILIAALTGAVGQALGRFSLDGLLGATLVGFIGAFFGVWLADQAHLPRLLDIVIEGRAFPLVWAAIGAVLLSIAFNALAGRRRLAG